MKKIYIQLFIFLFPLLTIAQIKIGGTNGNLASENVILQFGELTDGTAENPGNKGFLLPTIVSDFITKLERNEGTIFYDLKDGIIKYLTKIPTNGNRTSNDDPTFDFLNLTRNGEPIKHYNIYMDLINNNPDYDIITPTSSIINISDHITELKYKANNLENDEEKGIILGNDISTADGALVLEASGKGILLPRVYQPHLNIINPDAGLICYDTSIQMVAFFDGKLWQYWF